MTLTIKNGQVLLNGKLEKKNVIIEGGKIIEIGSGGSGETINATGKVILPGLIDVHVHLREPGFTHKEDFRTGTMAAAAGGVTTVLDMPNTKPATTTIKLLQEKKELAKEKAVVNYGFYIGATANNIEDVKKAAIVKIYLGSTTGNMLVTDKDAIKNVFSSGKIVVVHAENEELMKANEARYKKETDAYVHAKIRSNEVEFTAVKEAIETAGCCSSLKRLHLTHISTKESMQLVKEAKKKLTVSCDVTPHHLFLTYDELKKQGNFAKMNPALRSKEDVDALWKAISDGTVDFIVSEHAPHTIEEKKTGYWEAPSGVPGIETMLPLLLDAVNKGRLTLQQLARLTSENPARLFGIRNKGKMEIGYDADVVLVDMNAEKKVKNDELFTKCKWSPFNGWKLKGWPVTTIVNGNIVYDGGKINGIKAKEVEFQ